MVVPFPLSNSTLYSENILSHCPSFQCNRTRSGAREKAQTLTNRSKKLREGCPAKFVLKQNKEISKSVLPSNKTGGTSKGSQSKDFYEVTYIVSGCLTHSHETVDTEFDRLTARVRVSIVQLLRLSVSLQAIKDKYLRPEYFGGANGKVGFKRTYQGAFVKHI